MQEYKRRKKVSADENTAAAAGGGDDPQPGPPATVADGNLEPTKVASEELAGSCSDEKDVFYERLHKLNESSGLSLIINFRKTTLDLYVLYKEVTIRGGFHQVTKDGKWDEIASILKRNDDNLLMLASQLQNVYKSILHKLEQMYHYRTPPKLASPSPEQGSSVWSADSPNCLTGENRHCETSSPWVLLCSNNQDTPNKKRTFTADNCQVSKGPETPEQKPILQTSKNDRELKKERNGPERPVKARTAYQLYLKLECDRFKNTHGESSVNQKTREKIIDTWRHLSESERKPYIAASNKDKERYNRQMAAYKEHNNKSKSPPSNQSEKKSQSLFHISTQSETKSCQSWFNSSSAGPSVINFGSSLETCDDYYVTLQGEDGNEVVPDKSLVDSTIEMLKGAQPSDPIFQVDWDYYSF